MRVPSVSCAYMIVCTVNGKMYVGSTANCAHRWDTHLSHLKLGKHHSKKLQVDFDMLGQGNFIVSILEVINLEGMSRKKARHTLRTREQFYMDRYDSVDKGYNNCKNAFGGQTSWSDETRAAQSERMKGNTYSLGVFPSEETRAKMSEARMGHETSQETRDKISATETGKIVSEATKEKLRGLTGEKSSMFGRTHSDETKKVMSEKAKGRVMSDETRAKMSAAAKARQERERLAKLEEEK